MTKTQRGKSNGEWWMALALSACGAAQNPGPGRSDTVVVASESAAASGRSSPNADRQPPLDGATSSSESTSVVAASEQPHRALVLPAASAFVDQAIPEGRTARYEGWRELGRTLIGKGYLYFLDPLDERRLLVKSADETNVRIVDRETRREVSRWPLVTLDQDESQIVLAWRSHEPSVLVGKQDGLWQYAAESGRLLTQLAKHPVDRARWSDDGGILITAELAIPEQTARLRIYQAAVSGLQFVAELPSTERVDAWALSRDNRYLARVFYPSDRLTVVDLQTGQTLLDAPAQRYVGSVEFSPNGRWLALGGEGVKWFDLSDTNRRAEYTHFYNNVGDIEFSPSGDVLAVASFDGQVRLLTYDEQHNRLELLRSFSHQKNTNVYAVKFLDGGSTLVSSAGDQTVRYWGTGKTEAASVGSERWRSPVQWAERGKAQPPAGGSGVSSEVRSEGRGAPEHYTPIRLSQAPLPSRISPGEYECKISSMYKLRRCTVAKDVAGHTILEFDKENLLGIRGVLYDDGPLVRFEGWLTEGGSLGCPTCNQQPLHAAFRGSGGNWQGLLLYRGHHDPSVAVEPPPPDFVIEEAIDRFPLVLRRK